jgi:GNAT superfamily N-acetyltransferase
MTPNFSHHDASTAESILEAVISPVYEASHQDVISDPFYSTARFIERVRGYMKASGFSLVAAHNNHAAIGFAFGYALPASSRWWQGLTTPVPDGFTTETGDRTFAFNELMVTPEWQGQGVAHALHDELLRNRREERATLLVRESNETAQKAYTKWGWEKVGKLQPFPDAPHFDAMILPLPISTGKP